MILQIDTTAGDQTRISLKKGKLVIAHKSFVARRTQAEKLLTAIEKIIKKNSLELNQLKKIEVENRGGGFSALRIGVVTANALAYALGVTIEGGDKKIKKAGKIQIVVPRYDRPPSITAKKDNGLHHI